ncbi:hypothetical protein U0070_007804 [Myodes glareolus]|uniref:Uncharacterized protein n=1 Tax=Myodes glareolus TaxID=447135 RepID=A0AAW0ILF0_MYOGA
MAAFEKDHHLSDKDLLDLRDRDRESNHKGKRFTKKFGDSKRVFDLKLSMFRLLRPALMHCQLEHFTSQRSNPPVDLAKWFGSDVLQQPPTSMPTKVICVGGTM